jgi:magnesium chelatase subunit I
LRLIQRLNIDSLRAEITLFEAARAYTVAEGRREVTTEDIVAVAPLALRLRRSSFMTEYLAAQQTEDHEIHSLLETELAALTKGHEGLPT